MTDNCSKTENGRNVLPCELLVIAINSELFEQSHFSANIKGTSEKVYRIGISTRKYKKKYATLSFCPFCGADIDTQDYGFIAKTEGGENA